MLVAFLAQVIRGRAEPLVSARDGLQNLRVVDAIVVVHAGVGGELGDSRNILSHNWYTLAPVRTEEGPSVWTYATVSESSPLGVRAHEALALVEADLTEPESVARVMQTAGDCIGGAVAAQVLGLKGGDILMLENLRFAATQLQEAGIRLVVEMLNPYDVPGHLIATPRQALAVVRQLAHPNLKIQYDIYHAQRTEGELAHTLQKNLDRIGHIQIADNPGLHQPGTGEINFRFLFELLDRIGYDGYVGLEYVPEGTTEQSLGWVSAYGYTF